MKIDHTQFSEEHNLFRDTLRRFVEREINPNVDAWERAGAFPAHKLFGRLGQLGALGLSYPEEVGGAGLDYWYNLILAEELGRADCGGVPMAVMVQTDMCTPALAEHGSRELQERFLAPSIRGELVGAIGVTEPGSGSDVASIRTTAKTDGSDFIINGSKLYITNGAQADWVCLLARTEPGRSYRGMSLIVVPADTPGFSVSRTLKKLGMHSSDTAELAFNNVRVPRSFCIGEEGRGFQLQMQQFQKERLMAAILCYAAAQRMLQITAEYTREREAFGRPLLCNQWVHFRLAELLTDVELLKSFCYCCVARIAAGKDVTREASMAKLKAGRVARETADACVQFHGAMGYMEEYPVARYFRDARLTSIGAGADEVMLSIIAKYEGLVA